MTAMEIRHVEEAAENNGRRQVARWVITTVGTIATALGALITIVAKYVLDHMR